MHGEGKGHLKQGRDYRTKGGEVSLGSNLLVQLFLIKCYTSSHLVIHHETLPTADCQQNLSKDP